MRISASLSFCLYVRVIGFIDVTQNTRSGPPSPVSQFLGVCYLRGYPRCRVDLREGRCETCAAASYPPTIRRFSRPLGTRYVEWAHRPGCTETQPVRRMRSSFAILLIEWRPSRVAHHIITLPDAKGAPSFVGRRPALTLYRRRRLLNSACVWNVGARNTARPFPHIGPIWSHRGHVSPTLSGPAGFGLPHLTCPNACRD